MERTSEPDWLLVRIECLVKKIFQFLFLYMFKDYTIFSAVHQRVSPTLGYYWSIDAHILDT